MTKQLNFQDWVKFQGIDINKCNTWERFFVKQNFNRNKRKKLKKILSNKFTEIRTKQALDIQNLPDFQKVVPDIVLNECNEWEKDFLLSVYTILKKGRTLTLKQRNKLNSIKNERERPKPIKKQIKQKKQIYKINKYITLKLEGNRTNIYVDGVIFNQCKYLLINIPTNKIQEYDDVKSIDEVADGLGHHLERGSINKFKITPEQEFQAHCSNLQAWVEYDYDTRILHKNLAFPLLKKLTKVGDIKAKQVFKEEIAKRYEKGDKKVREFLKKEDYLSFLSKEEINTIIEFILEKEGVDSLLSLDPKLYYLKKFTEITNQLDPSHINNLILKNSTLKTTFISKSEYEKKYVHSMPKGSLGTIYNDVFEYIDDLEEEEESDRLFKELLRNNVIAGGKWGLVGLKDIDLFYMSEDWVIREREIKKRDNNSCALCFLKEIKVFHIFPLSELYLNPHNLISLCINCVNKYLKCDVPEHKKRLSLLQVNLKRLERMEESK